MQVGVCLEMRFHPYFRRIKELVDSGAVGKVLEVEHTEHIGPDRMAHTFVRGLWSRKEDSGPIFLSKCCHDADFLLWLTGGSVVSVEGSGRLEKFVPRADKPLRCLGCPDLSCPYSAVRLYHERREWVDGFDVPEGSTLDAVIDAELASGRYGRCVYHCDNDVFDTQDVKAQLSNGVTLDIHLEGTSMEEGRETLIHGTSGTLVARGGRIILPARQKIMPMFSPSRSTAEQTAPLSRPSSLPSLTEAPSRPLCHRPSKGTGCATLPVNTCLPRDTSRALVQDKVRLGVDGEEAAGGG